MQETYCGRPNHVVTLRSDSTKVVLDLQAEVTGSEDVNGT